MDTIAYNKLFADLAAVLIPDDVTMAGYLASRLRDEADYFLASYRGGDAREVEEDALDLEGELLNTTCPSCGATL